MKERRVTKRKLAEKGRREPKEQREKQNLIETSEIKLREDVVQKGYTRIRQMLAGVLGGLACGIQMMECYPMVPVCFTSLYMAGVKMRWIVVPMGIGMLVFMPIPAIVKYSVISLLMIGVVKIVSWATDGCSTYLVSTFASLVVMIVSFSGKLVAWENQPVWQALLLEGMFVLGGIVILHRLVYQFLEWKWENPGFMQREQKTGLGQGEQKPGHVRGDKLLGYAESFECLSKVFLSLSEKKEGYTQEEFGNFQNEITGKLCASCDVCAICWEQPGAPIYQIIPQMIVSVLEKGRVEQEVQEELQLYCKRSRDMVREATQVFERTALNRAWYNRLLENRQTIAEQLDAMAYALQDCAKEEEILDTKENRKLMDIRYLAREKGIEIEQLHLYKMTDGHLKLTSRMRSKYGECVVIKTFLEILDKVLGKRMRGQMDVKKFVSGETEEFVFYEDTRFRSVQGIERRKKDGAYVSGDNFSILELENGQFVMGLSDGMGSGNEACKESELVLDLVERFLEAGFSMETAIRMMNSAMVMKGEKDLFSTVDLCNINLYSGSASFFKIGAAASFLKRGKEVECLSSRTLPVGVGSNPEIERREMRLKNGDFVVMVTDGVLEYLHVPKPEETMQEIIESIDSRHPGVLVKKIMERVMLFTGGNVQDDMTILATCVWEK